MTRLPPPVLLGATATMLIIRFIPMKRARSILTVLSILTLSVIILGLRGMTPADDDVWNDNPRGCRGSSGCRSRHGARFDLIAFWQVED